MSLQLPAILSPPTPCIPSPALTVSPLERSPKLPCPLRVGVRFWASLTLRKLANASGRIVFNIALFMDWQFISGCLPPRLSTTQFPSTTDSQCSVRWGLSPHCWCALSGARRGPRRGLGQGNQCLRASPRLTVLPACRVDRRFCGFLAALISSPFRRHQPAASHPVGILRNQPEQRRYHDCRIEQR